MALSFAKDIRPLFRDTPDVDTMKDFGLDLSSFTELRRRRKRFMRASLTAACPATNLGQRSRLSGSSNGWTKAWRLPFNLVQSVFLLQLLQRRPHIGFKLCRLLHQPQIRSGPLSVPFNQPLSLDLFRGISKRCCGEASTYIASAGSAIQTCSANQSRLPIDLSAPAAAPYLRRWLFRRSIYYA